MTNLWCLFSRKGRSGSLNFPGPPTLDRVARQPIHFSSSDLGKYSQQIFSVASESTDFLKTFFLCSIPECKEARVECHIIGFSGSVMIWPGWVVSCILHFQAPGGVPCEWTCLINAGLSWHRDRGNQEATGRCPLQSNQDARLRQKGAPPYIYLRVPWLTTPHKGRCTFDHLSL